MSVSPGENLPFSLYIVGVLEEAKFFGLTSLLEPLKQMVKERKPPGDYSPITRREFITMLKGCALNSELRCQVSIWL